MRARLRPPLNAGDHVIGDPSSGLVLVEFGDYECPFCGRAHQVVKALLQTLRDRLCYSFRQFPLTELHPHALFAAEAAEAAAAQGRFWRMHEALYENQDALDAESIVGHAAIAGLDVDTFADDLRTHRFRERVSADLQSGMASGVHGTPTFFVNDVRHEGGWDFDSLWRALTAAEEQPSV